MYLKQKKAVFIRCLQGDYGYIDNLSTHQDLVLDKSGYEFLKPLSREPKEFNAITQELLTVFNNADKNTINK